MRENNLPDDPRNIEFDIKDLTSVCSFKFAHEGAYMVTITLESVQNTDKINMGNKQSSRKK